MNQIPDVSDPRHICERRPSADIPICLYMYLNNCISTLYIYPFMCITYLKDDSEVSRERRPTISSIVTFGDA